MAKKVSKLNEQEKKKAVEKANANLDKIKALNESSKQRFESIKIAMDIIKNGIIHLSIEEQETILKRIDEIVEKVNDEYEQSQKALKEATKSAKKIESARVQEHLEKAEKVIEEALETSRKSNNDLINANDEIMELGEGKIEETNVNRIEVLEKMLIDSRLKSQEINNLADELIAKSRDIENQLNSSKPVVASEKSKVLQNAMNLVNDEIKGINDVQILSSNCAFESASFIDEVKDAIDLVKDLTNKQMMEVDADQRQVYENQINEAVFKCFDNYNKISGMKDLLEEENSVTLTNRQKKIEKIFNNMSLMNDIVEQVEKTKSVNEEIANQVVVAKEKIDEITNASKNASAFLNELQTIEDSGGVSSEMQSKINEARNKVQTVQDNVKDFSLVFDESNKIVEKAQQNLNMEMNNINNFVNNFDFVNFEGEKNDISKLLTGVAVKSNNTRRVVDNWVNGLGITAEAINTDIERTKNRFEKPLSLESLQAEIDEFSTNATNIKNEINTSLTTVENEIEKMQKAVEKAQKIAEQTREIANEARNNLSATDEDLRELENSALQAEEIVKNLTKFLDQANEYRQNMVGGVDDTELAIGEMSEIIKSFLDTKEIEIAQNTRDKAETALRKVEQTKKQFDYNYDMFKEQSKNLTSYLENLKQENNKAFEKYESLANSYENPTSTSLNNDGFINLRHQKQMQQAGRLKGTLAQICGSDVNKWTSKKRMLASLLWCAAKFSIASVVFGPLVGGWLVAHYNNDKYFTDKESKVTNLTKNFIWNAPGK